MSNHEITAHKYVEFRYTISDISGNILENREATSHYVHGTDNDMFPKIEQALNGCAEGDRVQVSVTSEESYGQYHQELVFTDDINNVPEQFRELGAQVEFQSDHGETREFRVTNIENGQLTLDGNHQLAGKELIFLVEIINVRDATNNEIKQGYGFNPSTITH